MHWAIIHTSHIFLGRPSLPTPVLLGISKVPSQNLEKLGCYGMKNCLWFMLLATFGKFCTILRYILNICCVENMMQRLCQINSTSSSPQACPLIVYNRSHQNIKGVGVQHCIASWPPCLARALMYEAIFPTPTLCIVFWARRYRLHLKHNLSALGARVSLGSVNSVKNYKTDVFIYSWSGTVWHWDWQIALTSGSAISFVSVFVVKIKTEPGHLGMSRPDLM